MKKYLIVPILLFCVTAYGATRIGNTNIAVDGNNISAANVNGDVVLDANGTGEVSLTSPTQVGDGDGETTHVINGTSIDSSLEIHSSAGTDLGGLSVHRHADSATLGAHILGLKSRGTHAAETIIQSGDALLRIVATGYDGTDNEIAAEIRMSVDTTPGNNDMPGRIGFHVTDNGTVTPLEAARFDNQGHLHMLGTRSIRFQDSTGGQYIGFSAPSTISSSFGLELPSADGSASEVLQTNGSGVLSFVPVSVTNSVVTKTADYTITTSDYLIMGDTSGGVITFTLPTAVGIEGKVFVIKYIDLGFVNALTLDGNASETIDGSTTTTLDTENETLRIISDGSNWEILDRKIPSKWTSFTMVIDATTTAPTKATTKQADYAYWRRVGDSMEITYSYRADSGTGGTTGTGTYLFEIPESASLTIDAGVVENLSIGLNAVGSAYAYNATNYYSGNVYVQTSTELAMITGINSAGPSAHGDGWFALNISNVRFSFRAVVPITGWND